MKPLFTAIQIASNESDINTALLIVQESIGQTTGDTAGLFFSSNNMADNWEVATPKNRQIALLAYISAEIAHEFKIHTN